jgi:hypothetical protein
MRSATGSRTAKLGEFMVLGLLVLLLQSSGSGASAAAESVAADPVSTPVAPVRAPTLLDSLRAETALPAAAVRRPLELYLGRYSDDRLLVRRISRAVLRESRRQ